MRCLHVVKSKPCLGQHVLSSVLASQELIKESKGRLDARNKDGETPAHKCARKGDTNALRFLLRAVPKSFQVRDNGGKTPQEVANSVAILFLANIKAEQEKERAEREKDRAEKEQKKAQESERQAHEERRRAEKSELKLPNYMRTNKQS